MFEEFIKRENLIFEMMQKFIDAKLEFIVIGGYGVSAYKHRFSIDLDIVIKKGDLAQFEQLLQENKFTKTIFKALHHPYAPIFMRYARKDTLPVSVDLLVDGVAVRQTDASFSFDVLNKNSENKKITGTEKEVFAKVPKREILIALKLHAGRLTDFRDTAALCKDIDFELFQTIVRRGKLGVVNNHIRKLLGIIETKQFIDSFKGIFIEKKYDIDLASVRKLKELT